ncbi:TPA: FrpC operon protein, partial [Neisseria meningitidis]
MRPYATTIYQLFILFIGSVFTMTSCEPVNEQTSFNNPEPMTGFEHTVTFDFQGTKMVIPYGYLARYTQDNATKWLSDMPGQDAYSINLIEISVYYKKTDQGWVLEPYNQQNKAHFIQFLR